MITYYIKDRDFGNVSCVPTNLNELKHKVEQATLALADTFDLEITNMSQCNEVAKYVLFNSKSVVAVFYDYRIAQNVCSLINEMGFRCSVETSWMEL